MKSYIILYFIFIVWIKHLTHRTKLWQHNEKKNDHQQHIEHTKIKHKEAQMNVQSTGITPNWIGAYTAHCIAPTPRT